MIELRHLRYFIAVAEELHFGRAAQRLHIAQPGLSQQIQALEQSLGVTLLARSSRRVQLTAAGHVLLEEGRRAVALLARAEDLARRAGRGEVGRLSLGAAESATYSVLPELLRAYRQRYPRVDLLVRELPSPVQIEALRRGEIDVGLVRSPVDTEGLAVRTIREDALSVLLPEDHPLAARRVIALKALAGQALIVHPSTPRPSWADFMIAVCRQAGFEPSVAIEATDTGVAVSFVAAGLGVTLVPESLELLVRPGVVSRRVAKPAPTTRLLAVHRRETTSATVRGLLEVLDALWPAPRAASRAPR